MEKVHRLVQKIDFEADIRAFGSWALGARIDGHSDIDVLVMTIVPRDEFFQTFQEMYTGHLKDLVIVRDAFVPVIKFVVDEFHIDMVVAKVYDYPKWCDGEFICSRDVDFRSVSGYDVTQQILRITNPFEETFREALVRIKTWAIDNLVYSNTLGLLNGVGLAVMTAWILQTSPELSPDDVLQAFFKTILSFDFTRYGISIRHHEQVVPAAPGKPMTVYVPLIGPPSQWINAFHNVGPAQFACIRAAVERHPDPNPFSSFIQTHTHFLHVHMFSDKASHAAFVAEFEAKQKVLLRTFAYAHPFPHVFTFESETVRRSSVFIGLKEMPCLQVVSEFVVPFCTGDRRICTDVLSARHLPAFFFGFRSDK